MLPSFASVHSAGQALQGLVHRVSDVGVHPGLDPRTAQRVRLVNRVALLVAVLLLPYLAVFAALGQVGNAAMQVLGSTTLLGAIRLNHLGRFELARAVTLIIGNLMVAGMFIRLGSGSGIEAYGFAAVVAPLFFYPDRNWRAIGSFVGLTVSLMVGAQLLFADQAPVSPLPPAFEPWFYIGSMAGGLLTTFAFVLYFYLESNRLEQSLTSVNQQLQLLADTDALTGIANRRKIELTLQSECGRAVRGKSVLSLVMLDVDHFKAYNDGYGHQAGDLALQKLAEVLSAVARRPSDLAGRYGGEEFVLLLPDTDLAGACLVAERIRDQVEQLRIPHCGSVASPWLTCSLGVATVLPKDSSAGAELHKLADAALYRAKHAGRNCARAAEPADLPANPPL